MVPRVTKRGDKKKKLEIDVRTQKKKCYNTLMRIKHAAQRSFVLCGVIRELEYVAKKDAIPMFSDVSDMLSYPLL